MIQNRSMSDELLEEYKSVREDIFRSQQARLYIVGFAYAAVGAGLVPAVRDFTSSRELSVLAFLAFAEVLVLAAASGCAGIASPPSSPATPGASASAAPSSAPTPAVSPTTSPASPSSTPLAGSIREIRADLPRTRPETAPSGALEAVVAADTAFALRLPEELVREADANVFFSPYSISTALSMTYAGARGRTADQLADALGIRLEPAAWHAGRNAVELDLAAGPGPETGVVPLTLELTNAARTASHSSRPISIRSPRTTARASRRSTSPPTRRPLGRP